MKTGYYKAETINGVYFFSETLEDASIETVSPKFFYESLSSLSEDDDLIAYFCEDDAELLEKIAKEYRIH